MKHIKESEERILAVQLVMNADPDKYGSLINSYNQDFLSCENKYPQLPLDAYNLFKGWNKHQHPQGPTKGGLSFNNNGEEDGTALVNDGTKAKKGFFFPDAVVTIRSLLIAMPKHILIEQSCMSWATSRKLMKK